MADASVERRQRAIGDRVAGRFMMQVLWPSFLVAAIAEGVFFSMIDPHDLVVAGQHMGDNADAAYTIGFFVFWVLFAVSSGLTWILSRGSEPPANLLQTPEDRRHQDKSLIGR